MNGLGLPSAKRVSLLVMWAFIEHAQMFFCLPRVGPPVLVAVVGRGGRGGTPEGKGALGGGGETGAGGGGPPLPAGGPGDVPPPHIWGAPNPQGTPPPQPFWGAAAT